MTDKTYDRVKEASQTFRAATEVSLWEPSTGTISHRAKVFKSGNSLALRLPKALGLEAGMEMDITAMSRGRYALERVQPARRTIDISGFAGMLPGFKPAPREDFEERPSAVARRKALLGE